MITLIAAMDEQRAIGIDNQLPWRLSKDLQRFKRLTVGHPVLMGRKTADSLPGPLKGRKNVVVTRSTSWQKSGFDIAHDLHSTLETIKDARELWFVIGGGEIYQACLPYAQTMHLTHVAALVTGADAFFPEFDLNEWQVTHREAHEKDDQNEFAFEFIDYRRK